MPEQQTNSSDGTAPEAGSSAASPDAAPPKGGSTLLAKLKSVASWLWEAWGDPKNKNRAILLLVVLCAFGVLDPATATRLRDLALSMVL